MDLALVIKNRLEELRLEQKDLAAAAQVTESYISQLLARKKAPPAAGRTGIYARMNKFLKLPEGELSKLADIQRREELKKKVGEQIRPLHEECRELILGKCSSKTRREVRSIFEKEPFGELERLVTQTFLDTARQVVKDRLRNEGWPAAAARGLCAFDEPADNGPRPRHPKVRVPALYGAAAGGLRTFDGRTREEIRKAGNKFVKSERFDISAEICVLFLGALIESWDIDLKTFRTELVLNRKLVPDCRKQFGFMEMEPEPPPAMDKALREFLADKALSGDVAGEELTFLQALHFNDGKRPTPLYYYRELQNLRDPLHFAPSPKQHAESGRGMQGAAQRSGKSLASAPRAAAPFALPNRVLRRKGKDQIEREVTRT